MFAYSIYFYFRSNMSGFLQLSFFLGYNVAMCYAFFLILGSVSFRASMIFVRRIYRVVKSEWEWKRYLLVKVLFISLIPSKFPILPPTPWKGRGNQLRLASMIYPVIEEIERMTLNHRKCSAQECMKSRHYVVLLDLKISILICLFVLVQSS